MSPPTDVLRKGPIGPPVTNEDGGTVNPQAGFYVRAVHAPLDTSSALTLTGSFQAIPLVAGAALTLSFPNPDPKLRYYAEIAVPVLGTAAAAYDSQFGVQFQKTDSGGTPSGFVVQTNPNQRLDFDEDSTTANRVNQVIYRTQPVLGEDIQGAAAVAAGDTLLEIQFVALVSSGAADIPAGFANRWATLFETL